MASSNTKASPTFSFIDFDDSGASDSDYISNDNNFDLGIYSQETASAITYEISSDNGKTWRNTVKHIRNLIDGTYRFRAKEVLNGIESFSSDITLTIDRTGPDFGLIKHGLDQPNDSSGQGKKSSGQEFQNAYAFAAISKNVLIKTWGPTLNKNWGQDSGNVDFDGDRSLTVSKLFSKRDAFAALRSNGSVVTWGTNTYEEDGKDITVRFDSVFDEIGYSGYRDMAKKDPIHIKEIFSTTLAYAALREDGSIVTWGNSKYGGDSSGKIAGRVRQVFSTEAAFAALLDDGTVITWGDGDNGGDSGKIDFDSDGDLATYTGSKKVIQIFSTAGAFAALRSDGSVLTWGNKDKGGRSSDSPPIPVTSPKYFPTKILLRHFA